MEEKNQNSQTNSANVQSQGNIADLQAEKERLAAEVKKARKKQKIFNIIIAVMAFISVGGILLVFWIYKKVNEYKPLIESAAQMAKQTSDFMQANKIQSEIYASRQSTAAAYSQSGFADSSLSMIGFSQDSAAAAVTAAQDPESRQEMAEVVDEYKETPEMKEMLEEFKKDPELSKIFENYQSDPSQAMKKMNDPAVMKKIMEKMAKNPRFMATMLKMASDPRVMKAVSKQRSSQTKENPAGSN